MRNHMASLLSIGQPNSVSPILTSSFYLVFLQDVLQKLLYQNLYALFVSNQQPGRSRSQPSKFHYRKHARTQTHTCTTCVSVEVAGCWHTVNTKILSINHPELRTNAALPYPCIYSNFKEASKWLKPFFGFKVKAIRSSIIYTWRCGEKRSLNIATGAMYHYRGRINTTVSTQMDACKFAPLKRPM